MNEFTPFSHHLLNIFPDMATSTLPESYRYSCLPLCLIDAVFSMGSRYSVTTRVVEDFCRSKGIERYRNHSAGSRIIRISELVRLLNPNNTDQESKSVITNRQRTSPRNGILKRDAVYRIASVLEEYKIEDFDEFNSFSDKNKLRDAIRRIPGQKSGVCFDYFCMLAGDTTRIKADRMTRRFVGNFYRGERLATVEETKKAIVSAAEELRHEYENVSPALLDNLIWSHQRAQR